MTVKADSVPGPKLGSQTTDGAEIDQASNSLRTTPRWIWVLLCVGFIVRIAMAWALPPERDWVDGHAYHRIAVNVLSGNGVSMDEAPPYEPSRYRTPGYPAFLAVIYAFTGAHPLAAVSVQSVLGCLTIWLAYLLAQRTFGNRSACVAAVIVALYPALIYYDSRLVREGPTALCMLALVVIATLGNVSRNRASIAFGACLTFVSMVRPETVIPGALIGAIWFVRTGQWRRYDRVLAIALPFLIVWSAWSARNYTHYGSISPVERGLGPALWFGVRFAEIGGDDAKEADRQLLKAQNVAIREGVSENDIEVFYAKEAVSDLVSRPGWYVEMTAAKAVNFWKDANGVRKTLPRIHPGLATTVNAGYYGLLLFAVLGLARFGKDPRIRALGWTILTYMAVYTLLHVRNRYRVPVLPIVFVLSSGGVTILAAWVHASFARWVGHREPTATLPTTRPAVGS